MAGTGDSTVAVRVTHRYEASAERVFDAWLDPDLVGSWMFSPTLLDQEVVRTTIDPRVGGSFSFLVRRQGQEIDHVGTYREITRPRRLVFTWGIAGESTDESVVTVEIAPRGSGCELTLAHTLDAKWAEYAARTEGAWAKMLGVLADQLRR